MLNQRKLGIQFRENGMFIFFLLIDVDFCPFLQKTSGHRQDHNDVERFSWLPEVWNLAV